MTMYLYLFLNLGSLSIPLLYSIFEKEFHFIQYAKKSIISIFLVAIPFLIWDVWFTKIGVWGFNDTYHLPMTFFGMPLEEYLFFICIPYACLFTHEVLKFYLPKFVLSKKMTQLLVVILLALSIFIFVMFYERLYTTINLGFFIVLMILSLVRFLSKLQKYFTSFLIILIPFFIVNGVLTGSIIQESVVWYNNQENMGVRLFTIPLEDVFYAFNLLFSVQLIFDFLMKDNRV